MYYNTQTYMKLKEQRKHRLFMYSMFLALALLLTNIAMDYFLTDHIPFNAILIIIPVVILLLVKHFFSFEQSVYRSFYLLFIIAIVDAILQSRPEHATTTYWAYLIIIAIFTYESSIKNALIINGLAFLSLSTLAVLDYLLIIELPYSQFNFLSFLMIYLVLSAFILIPPGTAPASFSTSTVTRPESRIDTSPFSVIVPVRLSLD